MNESIPSSVQPAHAPQNPTICVRFNGVRVRRAAPAVRSSVVGMVCVSWESITERIRNQYGINTKWRRIACESGDAPAHPDGRAAERKHRNSKSAFLYIIFKHHFATS